MTENNDDLISVLEALKRAMATAERLNLQMLGYLLSMAIMEAAEQVRMSELKRRSAGA